MKKFFDDNVRPLLRSTTFVALSLFFMFLTYGYYVIHFSMSKDWLWFNVAGFDLGGSIDMLYQKRWLLCIIGWLTSSYGNNNYLSGIVGLSCWYAAAVIIVAKLNQIRGSINAVFSAFFITAFMCSGLYAEVITYPNMMVDVGVAVLCASVFSVCAYDLACKRSLRQYLYCVALLSLTVSGYEISFPLAIMLVLCYIWLSFLQAERPGKIQLIQFIVRLASMAVLAIALKYLVSYVLIFLLGVLTGKGVALNSGSGAATECFWLTKGLKFALLELVKGIGREFVIRPLFEFSYFVGSVTVLAWTTLSTWYAVRKRNLQILFLGGLILMCVLFFPIVCGHIAGTRYLLPMLPCLSAFLIFLIPPCRHSVFAVSLVFVFLLIYAQNLMKPLIDVCARYETDVYHAHQIIRDVIIHRGKNMKPVVIVGELNSGLREGRVPSGVAYRFQNSYYLSTLEKKLGRAYVKGGLGAQTTMLSSREHKRHELYKFVSYVDGYEFKLPCDKLFREAEDYARVQNMPSYPHVGYVRETPSCVIVNLGLL